MKPILLAAALSAVLGACADGAPAGTSTPAVTPAASPAHAQAPAPAPAPAEPTLHRFAFAERTGTPGPSDVRIVGTEPSPCGPVLVARVARIPLQDARVRPDRVVEFDAAGAAVRTWGVPHEALVTALDGGRVQFRTASGTYWAEADGTVGMVDANGLDAALPRPASLVDGGTALACPAAVAGADGGLQCATVRDAAGSERRLAVQVPCS